MELIIERGKVASLKSLPEYSIALDGFVQGPQSDDDHKRFSFDHHEGCSRFATLSACEQAWTAVMLGLDPTPYKVFCNDVDADVCASVWCLKNPDRCKEPLAKKLIDAIGMGDRYAGALPMNGMSRVVEWVCAPETDSKRNGDYEKISNDGLKSILEAILHRIDRYVDGEAMEDVPKQPQHSDFKVLRNDSGWALIESNDPHSLGAIWSAGFERIVMVRPLEDGSTAVTIARKSEFIEGFPMKKIFAELNKNEPGWGGGATIGGAPRNGDGSRSKLSVHEITDIIDSIINPDKDRSSTRPPPKKVVTNKSKPPTKK